MRASPIILGTTLALSFALLLNPNASNAQFVGKPCTLGNGLYSCDFKGESGTEFFSGSITLAVGLETPTSSLDPDPTDPDSPFSHVALACACEVKGSVDDNKPLKKSHVVLCTDLGASSTDLVLSGVLSGNPNIHTDQFFAGQLNVNMSKGYVFDCIGVE